MAVLANGVLKLTRAGSYAMRAMVGLARSGPKPLAVRELARREGLPPLFLSKILTPLVRAKLVKARPGEGGGVSLARPAAAIRLLDVLEADPGSLARARCAFFPDRGCEGARCRVACLFRQEETRLKRSFASVTIEQLAQRLMLHPANGARGAA